MHGCGEKMKIENISSSEIRRDIADTEAEIPIAEREAEGFRMVGDRLSIMRAKARDTTNQQRREFIRKLREILKSRGEGD